MQHIHIPEMLGTGCFESHQLVRLLQVDETDGPTYAVQYHAPSLTKYDYYLQNFSAALRKKVTDEWGEKYLDFRTLMQVME